MNSEILPKEAWEDAAERIREAAPIMGDLFERINFEGKGKKYKEDWIADMQLAYTAMHYVANAATDKCRFITY